jgi:outer membrane receptor protein involved in Fe transport
MCSIKKSPTRPSALALLVSALIVPSGMVMAQDEGIDGELEEITVTGTRITNQNIIAASPITTIGMEEIGLNMTPNVERIFRDLPITIPGDGENVNNGSAGQATLDLRGLGPERSLIMIDGKRLAPYDINGIVTTDVIPINMLERVDIVTGGASAVYGSDAMSGAINFILRKGFEGVEFDLGYSTTDSGSATNGGGEDTRYQAVLIGINSGDDRGNITIGASHTDRGSILLAEREFGLFGVSSTTGAGLGAPPAEPPPECSGNTSFTTAHATGVGSTTAIPATLNLRSGNSYQFRDNGDLILGECARFNFNPFNYYQTPQERWQATTIASYEANDNLEIYARATFSSNRSTFQIAPSGTFGTAFTIPVQNPFFNSATQTTIVDDLNVGAVAFVDEVTLGIDTILALPDPTPDELDTLAALQDALAADPQGFNAVGIQDQNSDGVFDAADSFTSTARRRTLELGPRTGIFDTDYFQYVLGARGELPGAALEGWHYDLSYQYGESDFVETRDGFTNLTNLQLGINTVDPDQCITPQGVVTDAPCTPINIFGPVGSITDQQRDDGFFIAIASDLRLMTQEIYHGSVDGTFEALRIPFADDGLSLAFGFEFSELSASSSPDECLKLAPASCQGGAGGNRLPVIGAYSSDEYFIEAILPLVQGNTFFENLSLELGYRSADYDVQGSTESWKAGFSWEFFEGFRFRFMEQQAVRVPNVGELFRPVTTGLDNATLDPCSIGNPNPPASGSELFNLCVQTGMLPSQVGQVPDIISGQINVFSGTSPVAPPHPEEATTTTFGVVWDSDFIDFLTGLSISLDYYNIEINDYIDTPTGQESLDLCYVLQDQTTCDGIVRIGGALGETGTGTPAFFTNFVAFEAEGIDLKLNTGFEAGAVGDFAVSWVAHQYLTNQFQTTSLSPVVDCKGIYGTSCDPVPEFRSIFRVNWILNSFDASLLWRYMGSMDAQANEAQTLFEEFRNVDSQSYFDLNLGYSYKDWGRFSFLVRNIADEDPPILGNNTGSTSFNSGNTFPSLFDTMGRTYSINLKVTF